MLIFTVLHARRCSNEKIWTFEVELIYFPFKNVKKNQEEKTLRIINRTSWFHITIGYISLHVGKANSDTTETSFGHWDNETLYFGRKARKLTVPTIY